MKTLALTPWNIYPADSGGRERSYNLFINNVDAVFALTWDGVTADTVLGKTKYKAIPADAKAVERGRLLMANGIKTYDPIPMLVKNDLTTFRQEINDYNPDLIILAHPWLLDLIGDRPFIYDAQNCETFNTGTQLGTQSFDYGLVRDIERRAVKEAEHITYCSQRDIEQLNQIQPITCDTTFIPNGTHIPDKHTTGEQLNLVFVGSLYGPNIYAAQQLANIANLLPEYTIQIIGDCALAVNTTQPNVQLIGKVSNKQLDYYLSNAHAFVNLVAQGSGTHLKIARAMSYRIPVITTPVGSRGYRNVIETTTDYAPAKIRELRKNWSHHSQLSYEEALTHDWDIITAKFRSVLDAFQ